HRIRGFCSWSLWARRWICYSGPNICSSLPWWQLVAAGGLEDEQWDVFGSEVWTELGFNPDGARRPFPPGHRAPQTRRRAGGASSSARGIDARDDCRSRTATECAKSDRAFERGRYCSEG